MEIKVFEIEGEKVMVDERFVKRASELNERVKNSLRKTVEGIIETGIYLKQMRDEKLYAGLGYTSFKEYVENELFMKRRNAYNFIQIAEKLPPKFVQHVAHFGMSFHKLVKLLPLAEELDKLDENEVRALAEMPMAEFNEEIRKWKARYMKKYRENEKLTEENIRLRVKLEEIEKQLEEAKREIFLLKTNEKTEKILKLQQEIENLMDQKKELEEKLLKYEKERLTGEQALALIKEALNKIWSACVDLRRVKIEPAFVPIVYSTYKMIREMLDAEIGYLAEQIDDVAGKIIMRDIAKDIVEAHERILNGEEIQEYTPEPPDEDS